MKRFLTFVTPHVDRGEQKVEEMYEIEDPDTKKFSGMKVVDVWFPVGCVYLWEEKGQE